jgi:hypothetical protein
VIASIENAALRRFTKPNAQKMGGMNILENSFSIMPSTMVRTTNGTQLLVNLRSQLLPVVPANAVAIAPARIDVSPVVVQAGALYSIITCCNTYCMFLVLL